jgi:hypothetical protein
MFSKNTAARLSLLVLVAALGLATPAAARPSRSGQPSMQASLGVWEQVWVAWQALWKVVGPASDQLDNGCQIDPYGRCLDAPAALPAQDQLDHGCSIDPLGQCAK